MEVLHLLVALTMLHLQNVRALQHAQMRLKFLKARLHHMEDLKDALALLEKTMARKALETVGRPSLCWRMHEDLRARAT